jgi:hypothetical protein
VDLTDEIDREETETLPKEKTGDLFFAMLNGKTVQDTISTSRGDFVVKFPKQKDVLTIARMAAYLRSGIPAGNFDGSGEYEIQKIATLDVMVDSGPAWFDKARKGKDFSWRNVPDASFVDEVYAKALSFRQKIQEQLKGAKKPSPQTSSEEVSGDLPADVDDGLFSGVAAAAPESGS